eukprot:Nk52_evm1s2137 gene=Nk52_evmTU1s2137
MSSSSTLTTNPSSSDHATAVLPPMDPNFSPNEAYEQKLVCTNCQNDDPDVVEDFAAGDLICGDCGLVLGDRVIDMRSEWRTFSNDNAPTKDQSRVGAGDNSLLSDEAQLATMIRRAPGGTGVSSYTNPKKGGGGGGKWQGRALMNQQDRALIEAVKMISQMGDRIGLPQAIRGRASHLMKEVDGHKLVKGRNPEGLVAACLHLACRMEGVPRTLKEISSLTNGVTKKEIGKSSKAIQTIIGSAMSVGVIDGGDYLTRFCSNLSLPMEVERIAKYIMERAKTLDLSGGKSPLSIAGTALYMASQITGAQNKRSLKEVGAIVGVSETTIRLAYKGLYPQRDKLFTPEFMKQHKITELPPV